MEGTEEDSLEACLLQWVQSFEVTGSVENIAQLGDGVALWSILQDIDADYFTGVVPEPEVHSSTDWTRRWQNLRHVEKQIAMYYRDICNGQEHISTDSIPDLKAIAAESSIWDVEKLIMLIIRTAMASPESNQRMAQRLMNLGRNNAMLIAHELRSMEEAEYTESEPASRDESAYHSEQEMPEDRKTNGSNRKGALYQDPLLEREEELLQANATIAKLQASHNRALRQMEELRQQRDELQEAFAAYRDEIETKGRKTAGDEAVKKLQHQAHNDRAYIEDLESQLQSSRTTMENYERQLQRNKDDTEGNQKLRDDIQMLRAENEDLNQKIKANENLKKKIQTLQEQERTNLELRDEIKVAHERLEDLNRLKQGQTGLEKEIIEKQGLIRNQEYQINELTTIRKHAEYDARVLAQKLQEARERHDRDHEAIQELRLKMQDTSLEDTHEDEAAAEREVKVPSEVQRRPVLVSTDDSKHLSEKLALLEQQLATADARLRQASERNAALEEQHRSSRQDGEDRQKAEQQIHEHEETIANLRKELDAAAKQKSSGAAPTQDMAALQRENHLMATAWYDLSSRLQHNGVSLARRRQEPKSWIGKQRALVGPGIGPVSVLTMDFGGCFD